MEALHTEFQQNVRNGFWDTCIGIFQDLFVINMTDDLHCLTFDASLACWFSWESVNLFTGQAHVGGIKMNF
jgi:hypothetical protein